MICYDFTVPGLCPPSASPSKDIHSSCYPLWVHRMQHSYNALLHCLGLIGTEVTAQAWWCHHRLGGTSRPLPGCTTDASRPQALCTGTRLSPTEGPCQCSESDWNMGSHPSCSLANCSNTTDLPLTHPDSCGTVQTVSGILSKVYSSPKPWKT